MSGSEKLDMAGLAGSGVFTADEIMKAMQSHHHKTGDANKHLAHAAFGAIVGLGMYELLRRDEEAGTDTITRLYSADEQHPRHKRSPSGNSIPEDSGHHRRIAEQIVGAYNLGQDLLGKKTGTTGHIAHVVTEAMAAYATLKEIKNHEK